jgi:hypothetical protein
VGIRFIDTERACDLPAAQPFAVESPDLAVALFAKLSAIKITHCGTIVSLNRFVVANVRIPQVNLPLPLGLDIDEARVFKLSVPSALELLERFRFPEFHFLRRFRAAGRRSFDLSFTLALTCIASAISAISRREFTQTLTMLGVIWKWAIEPVSTRV